MSYPIRRQKRPPRPQNVQSTSIESYNYVKHKDTEPSIGDRQMLVLNVIRGSKVPLTDLEISRVLRYGDPNHVRPRRFELWQADFIEKAGKRKCTVSGRKAITWRIASKSVYKVTDEHDLYAKFSEG